MSRMISTSDAVGHAAAPGKARPGYARLAYIDQIRVLLTGLVVMVHAGVTYGSIGGWFYVESGSDDLTKALLSLFVTLCQAFFMGLFFFISGYFIPGSYDRKGAAWFWRDRLLRLALPFALFSLVLAKYPIYTYFVRSGANPGSLWDFTRENFWTRLDAGPTWFLFGLLVLSVVYSLWRLASDGHARPLAVLPAPRSLVMLGFGLVMAALMLLTAQVSPIGDFKPLFGFIYLQPAFFAQYLMMFGAGILAYRGNWLERLDGQLLGSWRWVAVGCAAALPVLFMAGGAAEGRFEAFTSGFAWQALALTLWVGLTCVSFSLVLILGLRERHAEPGLAEREISGSAFAAFLIHPLVLIAITTSLTTWSAAPLFKFLVASALAITGSFALGWLLRKIPGMRKIL